MTAAWCRALLGSGEFLPWSREVDDWVLNRARPGPGPVLICPIASAPEGDEVFDDWARKGLEHFGRSRVEAEVLPLKTRADASSHDLIEQLRSSRVVYFSGGNPAYLARTLIQTPLWSALLEELDRGLAYIGCSAGVACLGEIAPDSSNADLTSDTWTAGLRMFPGIVFGPHWDKLDVYVPGLRNWIIGSVPTGSRLVAIDENTAVVSGRGGWRVMGAGGVTIYAEGEEREHHTTGESFPFDSTNEPDRA